MSSPAPVPPLPASDAEVCSSKPASDATEPSTASSTTASLSKSTNSNALTPGLEKTLPSSLETSTLPPTTSSTTPSTVSGAETQKKKKKTDSRTSLGAVSKSFQAQKLIQLWQENLKKSEDLVKQAKDLAAAKKPLKGKVEVEEEDEDDDDGESLGTEDSDRSDSEAEAIERSLTKNDLEFTQNHPDDSSLEDDSVVDSVADLLPALKREEGEVTELVEEQELAESSVSEGLTAEDKEEFDVLLAKAKEKLEKEAEKEDEEEESEEEEEVLDSDECTTSDGEEDDDEDEDETSDEEFVPPPPPSPKRGPNPKRKARELGELQTSVCAQLLCVQGPRKRLRHPSIVESESEDLPPEPRPHVAAAAAAAPKLLDQNDFALVDGIYVPLTKGSQEAQQGVPSSTV